MFRSTYRLLKNAFNSRFSIEYIQHGWLKIKEIPKDLEQYYVTPASLSNVWASFNLPIFPTRLTEFSMINSETHWTHFICVLQFYIPSRLRAAISTDWMSWKRNLLVGIYQNLFERVRYIQHILSVQ